MRKTLEMEARSFPLKAGGFGGVVYVHDVTEFGLAQTAKITIRVGPYETQEAAFAACYREVFNISKGRTMTVGHFRSNPFRKTYCVYEPVTAEAVA